ncbi:acyl-CoA thioesterase [Natronospira bacteriovora]|uniref:Thioesterase family protein n=1 Tax=Natronospira bacteriovora TaxID=3069753 RepID=A0ABU0W8B4_9GAMM|nr:thioesterase family protein [Natronospira sp. AB-CW4]MDQ2069988.1 thioesterase family protein [Natronospira sp. AB-CW4]
MKAVIQESIELEVPFQDLDPMGVAWHGNYFRYFEAGRAALLRSIDYDYPEMRASEYLWPIVDTRVKYIRPLEYAQRIRVISGIVEWENRLRIDYEIRNLDDDRRLCRAHTIQCAVDARSGELQFVSPPALTDRVRARLEAQAS